MKTKIQKWGNSQGVRLPRTIMDGSGLGVGQEVEILAEDDGIVIRPLVARRPKVSLADLVKRIPKDYQPEEISWGPPQGREIW